jgi:peptidoglycan/xylan/chitin deacetylase (PgdA/CDA1 family)
VAALPDLAKSLSNPLSGKPRAHQRDWIARSFVRVARAVDRRPGLSIMLFHRVLTDYDPFRPGDLTATEFEAIVEVLTRDFTVLPLDEAVARLEANSLPPAAASITFDDGYRDNLEIATPLLAQHGIVATIFITTGFLNGEWMFNDRVIEACRQTRKASMVFRALGSQPIDLSGEKARVRAAHAILDKAKYLDFGARVAAVAELEEALEVRLGRGPMLDADGVRQLRNAGMAIGAHTVDHPILTKVDDATARAQIHESRHHLVELLREPVTQFAFPNGKPGKDYGTTHVHMVVESGFHCAVSTLPCTARPGMSRYELPRFTPWDKAPWRFASRLIMKRILDGR